VTGATIETESGTGFRSMILFDRMGTDLNGDAEDALDRLAASLRGNDERVQLRAFGGDIADRTHTARRLALRRALAVRNYLMDHGIDQERITVRAMGGALDGGPSDRVDVVYPAS
jgi:outer membrane protein OmpA-like peptidoglycan-associated protein